MNPSKTTAQCGNSALPRREVHRRLSVVHENRVLPQHSVYEWRGMFKNGHRSRTYTEKEDNERVRAIILDARRMTTDEVEYH
jgi:hypothetical protein